MTIDLTTIGLEYKSVRMQSCEIYDQIEKLRNHLKKEHGLTQLESYSHPDVILLRKKYLQLYREIGVLRAHFIRANLEAFGIQDMVVTGVLYYAPLRGDGEAGRSENMLLSDLCGLRYGGLADSFNLDPNRMSPSVVVEKDGKVIGTIDSEGNFDYESAPDLRTALGFNVATDGGCERLIEDFDLDQATSMLINVIRLKGTSKKTYNGAYYGVLRMVFVNGYTSRRYEPQHGSMWCVATRELGEEHPGYPILRC